MRATYRPDNRLHGRVQPYTAHVGPARVAPWLGRADIIAVWCLWLAGLVTVGGGLWWLALAAIGERPW